VDETPGKGDRHQGHDARHRETNLERPVLPVLAQGLLVVFVVRGAGKVTALSAEVIIVTRRVPGVAETLLDGHLVQLPRVEFRVIRLRIVELAELSGHQYIADRGARRDVCVCVCVREFV